MNLSPHFTLAEFTRSEYAQRKGLDNSIPDNLMSNAKRIAMLMEQVRSILGNKITVVNSMYRSPAVNKSVGGAKTSYHLKALACDFVCPSFGSPYDIAFRLHLDTKLIYDQLIYEGTWVHIGLADELKTPRMQVMTMKVVNKKVVYPKGIILK
jgi:zinc D-Ala-D-Ala carboxypeptidase